MTPPSEVVVGSVIRPHGVRGEFVVEVQTDFPERFSPGSELRLRGARSNPQAVKIETSRPHKGRLLVKLEAVDDRNRAEELRGHQFVVPRDEVPEAEEGTFYFFELVGCELFDAQQSLGQVVDVIEDGGGLLLDVQLDRGRVLIPFVHDYLEEVDVGAGRISAKLPEGLLESCAFRS